MDYNNYHKSPSYCIVLSANSRPTDKSIFSYFSTKTYVVGTQKNRLDEMMCFGYSKEPSQ